MLAVRLVVREVCKRVSRSDISWSPSFMVVVLVIDILSPSASVLGSGTVTGNSFSAVFTFICGGDLPPVGLHCHFCSSLCEFCTFCLAFCIFPNL